MKIETTQVREDTRKKYYKYKNRALGFVINLTVILLIALESHIQIYSFFFTVYLIISMNS